MPELLSGRARVVATRERAGRGVKTVESAEPAAVAAEYAGGGEQSTRWLGTDGTLERLGLPTGGTREVDAATLERALRGQTAAEDLVRKPRNLRLEPDRRSQQVIGLAHTEFRFEAPEPVDRLWERSTAAEREQIESVLLEAADAAVNLVVSADEVVRIGDGRTFEPATGFVAAATIDRSPSADEGQAMLAVRTIVVGVQREDGAIVAITGPDAARERTLDAAQAAGLEAIAHGLTQRGFGVNPETRQLEAGMRLSAAEAAAQQAEAVAPRVLGRDDVVIEDPLDPYDRRLGPARHDVDARANELAGFVAQQAMRHGPKWLEDRYAEAAAVIQDFDGRAAVDAERYQDQRARLEERAAELVDGDPQIAVLQAKWDALSDQERNLGERHRDVFLRDHGETLARLVAVEREWRTLDEVEIANRRAQAIAAPTAEHEHLLGPTPDRSAPDREVWEELVGRIERERFYYEREAEQDDPERLRPSHLDRDSARRELEADISQLRAERGLDGPAQAAAVEVGMDV
ncbi:MAG TPA: hypothetical protein VKB25_15690 [Conexibacter sp.]|nr:hypothetical protein [Conexibacter sp.]